MMKTHSLPAAIFLSIFLCACHSPQNSSHDGRQTAEPQPPVAQAVDGPQKIQDIIEDFDKDMKDIGPASEDETKIIREFYRSFQLAVLGYRGAEAAAMLSESSLKYYALHLDAARLAIHAPAAFKELEKNLSTTIRATIRLMIQRLSREFIETATPARLYETAFSQGWIGYRTLSTSSIDKIHVYEKQGRRYLTGDFYYAGTLDDKRVMRIGFVQEGSEWKIDLIPIFVDLDQTVEKFIFQNDLDVRPTLDETIKVTNEALDPKNWKPSVHKKDAFSVSFPKAPLFATSNDEQIYTSSDYRYGQFDVRVKYYPESDGQSPFHLKAARDLDILSFTKPLEAATPQCTQHEIAPNTLIRCDFDIPSRESRAKAVWIFTKDRRYLLFNIARNDQYDDETAARFMQSFSFGLPRTP